MTPQPIKFNYLNHRGERGLRTVTPNSVWFGVSEYYKDAGATFFISAFDHDKKAQREFMISRINVVDEFDPNDPSTNTVWLNGLHYGMDQLCKVFDVDPQTVAWDSATETLDGDVQSVICKIVREFRENAWRMERQIEEYDLYATSKDTLPNGHQILEQAENTDGTVQQTVLRPNDTEYFRVVDSDEAYSPHRYGREQTMVLDTTGKLICVGDVVQMNTEYPFSETHGSFVRYVVEKSPGGYRLSYRTSEKGAVLPPGYTAGYMQDHIGDAGFDKSTVFSLKPVASNKLTIIEPEKKEISAKE